MYSLKIIKLYPIPFVPNRYYVATKIKIAFLLIIFSIFLLASCSSPSETNEKKKDLIIGSWEWCYSKLYWPSDSIFSPESVGYTEKRVFLEEKIVKIFRNDSLIYMYPYEVQYFQIDSNEAEGQLTIDDWTTAFFHVNSDTLIISTSHVDGPIEYFYRVE
ncbi:MAG: hypothetical protein H0Z29_09725 [Candidatus Marinimicrobia bacterium]|nr:hypothetical protein [Candidatus Neomarinimicrobiota bacterium]